MCSAQILSTMWNQGMGYPHHLAEVNLRLKHCCKSLHVYFPSQQNNLILKKVLCIHRHHFVFIHGYFFILPDMCVVFFSFVEQFVSGWRETVGSTGPAYTMQCHVSMRRCSLSTVYLQNGFSGFDEASCWWPFASLHSVLNIILEQSFWFLWSFTKLHANATEWHQGLQQQKDTDMLARDEHLMRT